MSGLKCFGPTEKHVTLLTSDFYMVLMLWPSTRKMLKCRPESGEVRTSWSSLTILFFWQSRSKGKETWFIKIHIQIVSVFTLDLSNKLQEWSLLWASRGFWELMTGIERHLFILWYCKISKLEQSKTVLFLVATIIISF